MTETEEGRRGTNPSSQTDAWASSSLLFRDNLYLNVLLYQIARCEAKMDRLVDILDARLARWEGEV
ncbi:MAG: hypothetical protein D5R96_09310 [Methanocalculus sp. MSAO_Arc2]|nr:MAG: hypothetical protein D5R96_09310 [Methanocalculus sp. MSAO_Arc2]